MIQYFKNVDNKTMNESLGYFLTKQILINRGLDDGEMNNKISYKYGITNSDLFRLVKRF